MNVASTQLHPNGWDFMSGFEVLVEFLGCRPNTSELSPPMEAEYESLGPEGQALADAFTFSHQLESAKLVEFEADPQALSEYMGQMVPKLTAEEMARHVEEKSARAPSEAIEWVEAQLRVESGGLYNQVASTEVEAGKAESGLLRVIDQRNVARQRSSELAKIIEALKVEQDATCHEAACLEAVLKRAKKEALRQYLESFHAALAQLLPLLLRLSSCLVSSTKPQVYIALFGEHSGEKTFHEIEESHHSYLLSVKETKEEAKASLLYSYKNTINGFAAVLTPDEASKLSELDEVKSVFPSQPGRYSLQTTRSWEFLGLEDAGKGLLNQRKKDDELLLKARYGRNVIVGLLDSGIWPESKSFEDEGMEPIPKSWEGICQTGDAFNSSHCNKKIIGARYYLRGYETHYGLLNTSLEYRSPRDKDGHGTHTSSTVGGRRVKNVAALGGFARGTASGGAPLVHLAIYKACWVVPADGKLKDTTCFDEDILAAMDDAVGDGVHVLSMSIGPNGPMPINADVTAMASFFATKRNIVVVCSAGNDGPAAKTVVNTAPWMITVGASSVDRSFLAPLWLGNGMKIEGQTISPYKLKKKMYPLVYATQVAKPDRLSNVDDAGQCLPGSLSPEKTKGKIVMCLRGNGSRVGKGVEVRGAGGVGLVLGNSPYITELAIDAHVLPATAVNSDATIKILKYINSTDKPMAYIAPARTVLHNKPAPVVAAFSGRGPNVVTPDLLKPDIIAPGLNILAAWSEESSPTNLIDDHRITKYNIISGTSMSCPHVAAAAALLRAIHPSWSSAAIRSALITTAGLENNMGTPITTESGDRARPLDYGAGHFRPTKAADPGLVYDASITDYFLFLCDNGSFVLNPAFKCFDTSPMYNLNYPSLAIAKLNGTVTVKRTVTNVGGAKSVYFSRVKTPAGFSVKVSPAVLVFRRVGEKKSFSITVKPEKDKAGTTGEDVFRSGWFIWSDGIHIVRSPMAVSLA
ncbi:subtilisin-like protease SBT5.6 [Diospyros lotus]|uniref:subtilisin-like protease SBT5.6 n=1 Tax=Diospyros lotus TaxID=55363 RepID=UPI002256C10F|nr:subtilisin-like protease SBT5.6 [Diospyros lotus]